MNCKTPLALIVVGIALLCATMTPSLQAQNGGFSGLGTQVLIGPQVPLTPLWSGTVPGDYVAAGVGMRNLGAGTVNISIPPGASIMKAWMFWAVIWSGSPPSNMADINGTTVNGNLLGTSGSPCWGGNGINFYFADVTGFVTTGANALSNFPSGLTNGAPPQSIPRVFPLCEGASLVVVFKHPAWDYNTIRVAGGARTFYGQSINTGMGTFTGWMGGNPADQVAHTTFIEADGQRRFANDGTRFNGVLTSGPGTPIKTADAFDGADGIANVSATDGLWDTHSLNVSAFFPNGVLTGALATTIAGSGLDCLTWGAQVMSVKTALNAFIDLKAGSCPNSVNINSKGKIPVSLLSNSWFDVANVDASTVKLNGVPATGAPIWGDVSTPYMAFAMGCYDCNLGGADLFNDLTFKFKTQDVVATLGNVSNGDCIGVMLTGNLNDGTPFMADDVIRVIDNSNPKNAADVSGFKLALEQNAPNPVLTGTSFQYTLPQASDVSLEVYNTLGQRVATVFRGMRTAGVHTVTWDGLSHRGTTLPAGSYVYRLRAGDQVMSKTLVISR